MTMDWNQLLNSRRVREVLSGEQTHKLPSDPRSEFQRDYGRTVFSTPVRRLQDKAQVFPLDPHDAIRTRLTHSLEVSTVARSLAQAVCEQLITRGNVNQQQALSIAEIAATCGLLHDIGNPPFGHAGELAIQDWFRLRISSITGSMPQPDDSQALCDFLYFEGNAQTIRLAARLQFIADHYGLNLTTGTMSAARKYLANSNSIDPRRHSHRKPGHFTSENTLVAAIENETGTRGVRNPITYLAEAADDIVYSVVDIEDGVKKGIVGWLDFENALTGCNCSAAAEALASARGYVGRAKPPLRDRERDEGMAQMFRTFFISKAVESVCVAFVENYEALMRGEIEGDLVSNSNCSDLIACCKRFARERIYPTREVLQLEILGRRIIHDLLDIFWEGVSTWHEGPTGTIELPAASSFAGKITRLISSNYIAVFMESIRRNHLEDFPLPPWYYRIQLITDYVCGMTDTYALNLHRRITLS